ncbi:hypothetical protein [Nocardia nova]|jgi:hypothetical protein|uniref:hypothetical protein n=1 Tax=Nocardia nova TaxID=37330 RepID=UPI0007A4F4E3|nr:hypothetical protein [Nocardia nova]
MRADAWAALAAWVTAGIALVTVIVAGWFANKQVKAALGQIEAARDAQRKQDEQAQTALATQARLAQETLEHEAREAQKTRDEQSQPNVVMFTEPNHTFWEDLELVVKNFGATPAYDVRLSFDTQPQVSPNPMAPSEGVTDLSYPEVIPILAPAQEWRTSWDYAPERLQAEGLATRHEGTVAYTDSQGKPYTTKAVLDWDTLKDTIRMEVKTVHHVAKLLQRQNDLLESMTRALNNFGSENSGVWVYAADAAPEAQRRERRQAERKRHIEEKRRERVALRNQRLATTPPTDDQTTAPRSTEPNPESPAPEE